jgi:hypothetical protein
MNVALTGFTTSAGVRKAEMKVAGHRYSAATGTKFAGNFRITRMSGSCAWLLYGDQPFALCR